MPQVIEVQHPLIRHHLAELRNRDTQPAEFRRLVQRLAVLLAYEATKDLELDAIEVQTPLALAACHRLRQRIGLIPILRAGLGMVDPVINLIPSAEVWHLGVYRDERTLRPVEYYSRFPAAQKRQYRKAVIIPVEGPILRSLERFLYRRLDMAQEMGADLVILEINSPGGLLTESLNIANRLRTTDWATTVSYVPSEALSGAAIASLGCDQIVMHPEARLGDAGPIYFGKDALFRHAPEKLMSDLAVQVRTLAESKNRPPALAEAMVDRNCEVFEARNLKTGESTYLSEHELETRPDAADWEKGKLVFESRKDHFLEVTGKRAAELGLAVATVESREQLNEYYELKDDFIVLEHTWVDTTAYLLNTAFFTGLLLIVGMVGLYVEFSAPGTVVGGMVAAMCFALFFWSRMLGGTAGWLEVTLFITGLGFVAVEIFLLPGLGIAGFAGGILIVVSIVLASQRFIIPQTSYDLDSLLTFMAVMVGSGVGSVGVAFLLRKYFGLIPALSGMILLPPPADTPSSAEPEIDWRAALVGQHGVCVTSLRPAGKARIGERVVDVSAEGSYILPGNQVRVVSVSGNRVIVVEA